MTVKDHFDWDCREGFEGGGREVVRGERSSCFLEVELGLEVAGVVIAVHLISVELYDIQHE